MAYDVIRNFSNIFAVSIAGGTAQTASAQQLTRENQHIESLRLSRDGRWLAYDSDRAGNFDIYKLRVDSGQPIQLTTNPANDFAPAWSPDDRELVFYSTRYGTRDIHVIDDEGNAERRITSNPDHDFHPDFSPDGRKIVFYTEGAAFNSIHLMSRNAAGEWSPQVSVRAQLETLLTLESRTAYPRFSPDGKAVAFVYRNGIGLIPLDGSPIKVIAERAVLGGIPMGIAYAGTDPSTVYVAVASLPTTSIYAIPTAGGTPRLVLRDEPGARLGRWEFTTDGRRLFFTRAAWEADVWVMELKR